MVQRRSLLAALGSAALAGCLASEDPADGEQSPCDGSVPEAVASGPADCDARISQAEVEEDLHTCGGRTVDGHATVYGGACTQPLAVEVFRPGDGEREPRTYRLRPNRAPEECDARSLGPDAQAKFYADLPPSLDGGDELTVRLRDGDGRIVAEQSVVVEEPKSVEGPENCG